jgi:hypothetical protein
MFNSNESNQNVLKNFKFRIEDELKRLAKKEGKFIDVMLNGENQVPTGEVSPFEEVQTAPAAALNRDPLDTET